MSAGYLTLQMFVSEGLSAFMEQSRNSWTGWPSSDKAFTLGCSQKAAATGSNSNQSLPTHLHHPLSSELLIHLWTEIVCLFSFLSLQTFGGKLNLMPRGRIENWAK